MKHDRLAKIHMLPCVVCEWLGIPQETPTECHHLKNLPTGKRIGMGYKRADDEYTIPLCQRHHWNGVHNPMALETFESLAGHTEPELWEITNQMLGDLE